MKSVLFAGSEALPFAATGGLGDVMGSLPAAIKAAHPEADVRAVMPLYSKVGKQYRDEMTFEKSITVTLAWRRLYCGIFSLERGGVKWYFIDNEYYFLRDRIYGEFDDAERFAFFSVAVLELMGAEGFFPEVLHCNDWQTALSVILLKTRYNSYYGYSGVKAVYTIHNIDYQGEYGMEILGDVFSLSDAESGIVEYNGNINLTKGAIVCADFVTTVSPHYAKEIQDDYFAHGLGNITRMYSGKIDGIINGIDIASNDPKTDPDIPKNYSWRSLTGKVVCKEELQKMTGLNVDPEVPIVAMISRLAEHKGFDIVRFGIDGIMQNNNIQFVLLGTGDPDTENFFRGFASRYPGRAAVMIKYDRKLSKQIYAGADIFLMPSKSEACGLAQMIASRYGTVPVVHEVGGLYDTIKPYGAGGNGFTFAAYNADDMGNVIYQATELYKDKEAWKKLVRKIMRIDFSWNVSAEKYVGLYENVINQ